MERVISILFSVILNIYGATMLSETISDMTLDSTGNPYIVSKSVTIPQGKTLKIKPGCVFLFKPYTGITVDGCLKVIGTKEFPIVFTTENDSKHNIHSVLPANPFDWNGIQISKNASSAYFSNTMVCYSVFGIKSQTENIGIENGVFFQNGQYQFTLNGQIMQVHEGFPFTYNARVKKKSEEKSKLHAFTKKGVPAIIGGSGLVSGLITGISTASWFNTKGQYKSERSIEKQNTLEKQGQAEMATALVCGGLSVFAIPIALYIYIRNNKQAEHKDKVALTSAFSKEAAGLSVTLRF